MASTPSFDRFVAIDWSGAQPVSKHAIAVAEAGAQSRDVRLIHPERGDRWSRSGVADWISARATETDTRTLVGIDANFSYDAEAVSRHVPGSIHASQLWAAVDAACAGCPEFHGVGYWQHPDRAASYWMSGPKPAGFAPDRRLTEIACSTEGLGFPESPFKLLGPKQVGRGGLAVMRLCYHLRERLGERIAIWPFDPPDAIAAARIVLCEIFPRLFILRAARLAATPGLAKLRTPEAIKAAIRHFDADWSEEGATEHDADALVSAAGMRHFFNAHGLPSLPAPHQAQIQIEGWIMGLPFLFETGTVGSGTVPAGAGSPARGE